MHHHCRVMRDFVPVLALAILSHMPVVFALDDPSELDRRWWKRIPINPQILRYYGRPEELAMQCAKCGKECLPTSTVCSSCNTDLPRRPDPYSPVGIGVGIIAGFFGYFMYGVWGAVVGFFLCGAAANYIFRGKAISSHELPVSPSASPIHDETVAGRLNLLKTLHDQGLVTDEEYANRKREILAKI